MKALESDDSEETDFWYILSHTDRYLCSSDWIQVRRKNKKKKGLRFFCPEIRCNPNSYTRLCAEQTSLDRNEILRGPSAKSVPRKKRSALRELSTAKADFVVGTVLDFWRPVREGNRKPG